MSTQSQAELSALPEQEIRRQLNDCRITLESIRPYRCKDISDQQAALRAELARRTVAKTKGGAS